MAKRVLIVDDEENIREMTGLALEAVGYEVGEAASGSSRVWSVKHWKRTRKAVSK